MKTLIAIIALSLSLTAQAADVTKNRWVKNDAGYPVVMAEQSTNGSQMMLYSPCSNYLTMYDDHYRKIEPQTGFMVRFRVDDKPIHELWLTRIASQWIDGYEFAPMGMDMPERLFKEMLNGNKLRVQFKDTNKEWSDRIIERYTLIGFTTAVNASYNETCSTQSSDDSQFFDNTRSKADKDFF